jgi:hypothetical protein
MGRREGREMPGDQNAQTAVALLIPRTGWCSYLDWIESRAS